MFFSKLFEIFEPTLFKAHLKYFEIRNPKSHSGIFFAAAKRAYGKLPTFAFGYLGWYICEGLSIVSKQKHV